MALGTYPTLTPFTQLTEMTEDELVGTLSILLNNGLNVNQYVSLQILVEWINQNWSNVANLPPLELTDLTTTPPVNKYVTYNVLEAAFTALNISFTQSENTELMAHLGNYNNPHEVDAAEIGLNFLQNLSVTTYMDIGTNPPTETYVTYDILDQALDSFNLGVLKTLNLVPNYPPFNPNASTNGQGDTLITYADLQQALFSTQTFNNGNVLTPQQIQQLQAHLVNYDNPHQVTAAQVGLGNVGNYPPTYITDVQAVQAGGTPGLTYITYNILSQALSSLPVDLTADQIQALLAHLVDYNNPHEVTAAQVGLGSVANLYPVGQTDITNVNNGQTPPDAYITYNMLKLANRSLGFHTNIGVYLNVTITNITETSMQFNAIIKSVYNYPLENAQVAFTFYPTANISKSITTTPIAYSQAVNNVITITEGPFTASTSYSVSALLTDTTNANVSVQSTTVSASTLAVPTATSTSSTPTVTNETPPALASGTYFFDIVGGGSSDTTELDSATINGSGGSFNGNTYVAGSTGNLAISDPIGDPSADGNFTSCSSQISFSPSAFITPQAGSSETKVILSETDYNTLSNGEVLGVIVNGNIINATIGSNCQLNYAAAYSTTAPGSTYTVPASTQTTQPSILVTTSSGVTSSPYQNFFNGSNIVGSVIYGTTYDNYYTGADGSGNVTGSVMHENNFYSGANGTGSVLGSSDYGLTFGYYYSQGVPVYGLAFGNCYSGANRTGNVILSAVVSSDYSNYYTGNNGAGTLLGSTDLYEINFYSGYNGTGNSGMYVNQFFLPFPTTTTVPAYTVTNPSTTTNYPAVWSLTFNSGVLNGTPSLIFNNANRQPVGCISTTNYNLTGSNLIGSNSSASTIYLNGPQSFTNGQVVQAIVNGSPVNLTIGNGVTYNTQAAYTTSQTVPGSTYTVPASSYQDQPNISIGSFKYLTSGTYSGDNVYYSGADGSGNIVGYVNGSNYYNSSGGLTGATSGENFLDPNREGAIDNTAALTVLSISGGNYYTDANGAGSIVGSITGNSNAGSNYYSGSNGGGNQIGSYQPSSTYTGGNFYTGSGTSSPGLMVNQFFLPYPTTQTTPAYTVTNPSTTTYTTHPALYYLSLSSPLANTPTGIYATNESYNYPLAPLTVTDETYDSGVITLTLSAFTGNGRYIELGLQNMIAGDTLIELKGNVTQA